MELHRHRENENVFYLYERWQDQEALEAHFEQPYTKRILELNEVGLISPMVVDYLEDVSS